VTWNGTTVLQAQGWNCLCITQSLYAVVWAFMTCIIISFSWLTYLIKLGSRWDQLLDLLCILVSYCIVSLPVRRDLCLRLGWNEILRLGRGGEPRRSTPRNNFSNPLTSSLFSFPHFPFPILFSLWNLKGTQVFTYKNTAWDWGT
jgi:hypothetical protein